MPQTLSKCRCRSHVFTSTPKAGERLQDKARIWCNRNRFKQKRKTDKADFVPVQTKTAHVPQEEDWEQEIEEISRRTEKGKEMSNKTPYGNLTHWRCDVCSLLHFLTCFAFSSKRSKNFQALAVPMKGLSLLLVV